MRYSPSVTLTTFSITGKYPVESLKVLRRIAKHAETQVDHFSYQHKLSRNIRKPLSVSESIASTAGKRQDDCADKGPR
jgi:pyruvate kinase